MSNNETYYLVIDKHRRRLIERNHTATHLLHQTLKEVLGNHVNQAGSLVEDGQLRFDFTHFNQVTEEELKEMEKQVNQKILENIRVETTETTIDKAKEMGAVALFGEKYGKHVRVVSINDYSKELCGGTHVETTSEIGLFKILSESGIGAGTRRIIARTSEGAYQWIDEQLNILNQTSKLLRVQSLNELPIRVEGLQKELKDANHVNESLHAKLAESQAEDIFKKVTDIDGITVIAEEIKAKDMNQLRKLADKWKQNDYSDILVLGLRNGEKVNLIASLNDKARQNEMKAGNLIKFISPYIKGGGGGRDDFAQAGGKKPEGLSEALQAVPDWVEKNS